MTLLDRTDVEVSSVMDRARGSFERFGGDLLGALRIAPIRADTAPRDLHGRATGMTGQEMIRGEKSEEGERGNDAVGAASSKEESTTLI